MCCVGFFSCACFSRFEVQPHPAWCAFRRASSFFSSSLACAGSSQCLSSLIAPLPSVKPFRGVSRLLGISQPSLTHWRLAARLERTPRPLAFPPCGLCFRPPIVIRFKSSFIVAILEFAAGLASFRRPFGWFFAILMPSNTYFRGFRRSHGATTASWFLAAATAAQRSAVGAVRLSQLVVARNLTSI